MSDSSGQKAISKILMFFQRYFDPCLAASLLRLKLSNLYTSAFDFYCRDKLYIISALHCRMERNWKGIFKTVNAIGETAKH